MAPYATAAAAHPTLQGRLAAATTSSSTNPRSSGGGAAGLGSGSGISVEEAAALRKELEQTEVLLRGYQQENEAATRRIKVGLRGRCRTPCVLQQCIAGGLENAAQACTAVRHALYKAAYVACMA